MSQDSYPTPTDRPDLDDVMNVTSAHSSNATAAAAREFRNPGADKEPLSIAAFALCAVMLIIGGTVLGKTSGALFDYKTSIQPSYVRGKAPGVVEEAAILPMPILDAYVKKGANLYSAKCNGCHLADGKGNGVNVPSLAGSTWVTGPSDRFAQVILNGLVGPISTGKVYDPGGMQAQGAGMTPQDLALLMTYIRNNFGNSVGDVISPEMAQAAFDISAARPKPGTQVTAEELKGHEKDLPGEKVDPAMLVDPITLAPVAAK
jgi:mono/diheme cytochrome c family protein